MDSAVKLYNTYSNLSKFINVYYAPGVPTAEASSNGDLRFGKERSYMFVGTAMHEMAHTMGMGTTSEYKSMMDGGVFKGEKAQALLKEIDGPDAELHGDSQHFWPYGINYASEVHSEQDLINHVKIVEAMYQDIFKEAFYREGHLQNVATGKCMGISSDNGLLLMDCTDTATFIKMFSVGEPVAYRIQLGNRSLDVPNESTLPGVTLSTYGYNGGAHQKMYKVNATNSDSTVFFLKIVKSDLYIRAGTLSITQEQYSGDEMRLQWTWYVPAAATDSGTVVQKDSLGTSDSSNIDAVFQAKSRLIHWGMRPMGRSYDLKGRYVDAPAKYPGRDKVLLIRRK